MNKVETFSNPNNSRKFQLKLLADFIVDCKFKANEVGAQSANVAARQNLKKFERIFNGIQRKPKYAPKRVESTKRQITAFMLLKQCSIQHCHEVVLIDNEINAQIKCRFTVISSTVRHHKI